MARPAHTCAASVGSLQAQLDEHLWTEASMRFPWDALTWQAACAHPARKPCCLQEVASAAASDLASAVAQPELDARHVSSTRLLSSSGCASLSVSKAEPEASAAGVHLVGRHGACLAERRTGSRRWLEEGAVAASGIGSDLI